MWIVFRRWCQRPMLLLNPWIEEPLKKIHIQILPVHNVQSKIIYGSKKGGHKKLFSNIIIENSFRQRQIWSSRSHNNVWICWKSECDLN